ncbi:MAG: hypothetical protein HDR74_06745 [Bacteroides sp.]|nr:hypothetical protein [Bacteroides sp.]
MAEKTFTEKIIDVLINGNLPHEQGDKANETGLILVLTKNSTPVCASYGSSKDITLALLNTMEQNTSIKQVMLLAVGAYVRLHHSDPFVAEFRDQVFRK